MLIRNPLRKAKHQSSVFWFSPLASEDDTKAGKFELMPLSGGCKDLSFLPVYEPHKLLPWTAVSLNSPGLRRKASRTSRISV